MKRVVIVQRLPQKMRKWETAMNAEEVSKMTYAHQKPQTSNNEKSYLLLFRRFLRKYVNGKRL